MRPDQFVKRLHKIVDASEAGRQLVAKRTIHAGGRPAVLAPCVYCGKLLGARARREHQPHCKKKPKP